jgi:hypothetical protein
MRHKRALLYATLALAVPLPALALEGGSGDGSLDVQASLAGCAVAEGSIVCTIDTSFSGIEDAEYYTGSVTAPDGSVTDFGMIAESRGGGSASLSVPYTGNGSYTVTVSAWGYDERGKAGVVRSEDADTGGGRGAESGGQSEAVETAPTPPQPEAGEEVTTTPAPVEVPEEPPEPCPDPTAEAPSGEPVAGGAQGAEPPPVEPAQAAPGACPQPEPAPAPPPAP